VEKHPEYQSMLEKLHLAGDTSDMSITDAMRFMGYFTAISKGKMCPIKLDMVKKKIDFKPEDFDVSIAPLSIGNCFMWCVATVVYTLGSLELYLVYKNYPVYFINTCDVMTTVLY
jgi:hypothetical protein